MMMVLTRAIRVSLFLPIFGSGNLIERYRTGKVPTVVKVVIMSRDGR